MAADDVAWWHIVYRDTIGLDIGLSFIGREANALSKLGLVSTGIWWLNYLTVKLKPTLSFKENWMIR